MHGGMEELTKDNLPFNEAVKGIKQELKKMYPQSNVLIMGSNPVDKDNTMIVYEYIGSEEQIQVALVQSMHSSGEAVRLVNKALQIFLHSCDVNEAEQAITAFQDLIGRCQQRMDPDLQTRLIKAEIKRLRKQGMLELMRIKEKELSDLLAQVEARKAEAEKKARQRARRLEILEKARAVFIANCEQRRLDREKAEKDRQKGRMQFQPGQAAKRKQQKLRERQAERNARKKKASEGNNFHAVRNACSLGHA